MVRKKSAKNPKKPKKPKKPKGQNIDKTLKKKWRNAICHPKQKNKSSCLTHEALKKLKNKWNIRKPNDQIKSNIPKKIWDFLKERYINSCDNEKCWLKQNALSDGLTKEEINSLYAPTHPASWKKNKNEWLSNFDIEKVMKQYEDTYDDFAFIGATPIDFDFRKADGKCVWNELCEFKLEEYIKKNKRKIGIIFNTDKHNEDGAHWISMFIDISKSDPYIFFFDSTGDAIPSEIKKLQDRIVEQGKQLNINFKTENTTKINHQQNDTECGIYCLYLIINLLEERKTVEDFKTKIIRDDEMEPFRKIYFNSD